MTTEQTTPTTSETTPNPALAAPAAGPVEGQTPGAVIPGAQPQESAAPAKRVYSEEEWNKRQSAIDKQVAEITKTHKTQLAQIEQQKREVEYSIFLKKTEEAGGDMTAAQKLVEMQRATYTREAALAEKEASLRGLEEALNKAGKGKRAYDLVREHKLPESAVEKLMGAEDELAMENIALKLVLEKNQTDAKKTTTPTPAAGSTKGVDFSKMPARDRLAWAIENENKK